MPSQEYNRKLYTPRKNRDRLAVFFRGKPLLLNISPGLFREAVAPIKPVRVEIELFSSVVVTLKVTGAWGDTVVFDTSFDSLPAGENLEELDVEGGETKEGFMAELKKVFKRVSININTVGSSPHSGVISILSLEPERLGPVDVEALLELPKHLTFHYPSWRSHIPYLKRAWGMRVDGTNIVVGGIKNRVGVSAFIRLYSPDLQDYTFFTPDGLLYSYRLAYTLRNLVVFPASIDTFAEELKNADWSLRKYLLIASLGVYPFSDVAPLLKREWREGGDNDQLLFFSDGDMGLFRLRVGVAFDSSLRLGGRRIGCVHPDRNKDFFWYLALKWVEETWKE